MGQSRRGTSHGPHAVCSNPALNEEDGISNIIQRVLAVESALKSVGMSGVEVIVVDDGSRDRTPDIVAALSGVRLIRHPTNRGTGQR